MLKPISESYVRDPSDSLFRFLLLELKSGIFHLSPKKVFPRHNMIHLKSSLLLLLACSVSAFVPNGRGWVQPRGVQRYVDNFFIRCFDSSRPSLSPLRHVTTATHLSLSTYTVALAVPQYRIILKRKAIHQEAASNDVEGMARMVVAAAAAQCCASKMP